MCMFGLPTTFTSFSPTRSTPGPRRRQPTFRRCTFYIHCYRFTSKQNLSTIQRNIHIPSLLRSALQTWTTKNSLPSLPKVHLDELWQRSIHSHHTSLHNHITHKDITRFKQLFPEAIFHNEDKRATSLRIYCPVIYFQCLTKTFADPLVFRNWKIAPTTLSRRPTPRSPSSLANHTHGLLGLAEIYRMPTSYPNAKNSSWQDDRLLASLQHLFDPC